MQPRKARRLVLSPPSKSTPRFHGLEVARVCCASTKIPHYYC
nr:MAG TPA: hypothetical protein [Caudoviricetes sp.]